MNTKDEVQDHFGKIPPEIASRIFLAVLDAWLVEECYSNPYMAHPLYPLLLVSRYWNTITMTTPRLWSSVIVLRTLSLGDAADFAASLDRSGSHPLDIYFHLQEDSIYSVISLHNHVDRWRSVTFFGRRLPRRARSPESHVDEVIPSLLSIKMPNLGRLCARRLSVSPHQTRFHAPHLKELVCEGGRLLPSLDCGARLARLEVSSTGNSTFLHVLSVIMISRDSLQHLRLGVSHNYSDSSLIPLIGAASIVCPALKTMELHGRWWSMTLLLETPHLENLSVYNISEGTSALQTGPILSVTSLISAYPYPYVPSADGMEDIFFFRRLFEKVPNITSFGTGPPWPQYPYPNPHGVDGILMKLLAAQPECCPDLRDIELYAISVSDVLVILEARKNVTISVKWLLSADLSTVLGEKGIRQLEIDPQIQERIQLLHM